MKILIIGGTGFIGAHLSRLLIDGGHDLAIFHRGQREIDASSPILHFTGDRNNLFSFASAFKKFSPDVVIDMILYNESEALSLMDTFRGIAERIVALSSMDVYQAYGRFMRIESGGSDPSLLDENSPLRSVLYPYRSTSKSPDDLVYNYEKINVERVVMTDPKISGTVLRLPKVYGPGDNHHYLLDYLKRMDDGRSVILIEEKRCKWRWTRGYVENVAVAAALAATDERAANRIYNIGEPDALTEAEWVDGIAEAAQWRGRILSVPNDKLPNHLRADYDWERNMAGDTNLIRKELGYAESIPRKEALRRTVEWERANPPKDIDSARFNYAAEDEVIAELCM